MFLKLLFCGIIGVLVLVFLWKLGRNLCWNHLVLEFYFAGRFLITTLISLGFISLFKFFISSWFNFGRLYIERNSYMFFKFSNLEKYKFLKYILIIFQSFLIFVSVSLFLSLILLISIFSLLLANCLNICQSCCFSQRAILHFTDSFILFFLFLISLISAPSFIISCHLLLLGVIPSLCSRTSRCVWS